MSVPAAPPGPYDAIVVGGGPAGLSAALMLGRCRRRVLVIDAGRPRNAASRALHGFLTRDGLPPTELLALARAELSPYDVTLVHDEVVDASCGEGGFAVAARAGTRHAARALLLATGVVDRVPAIEGLDQLYGRSVFHCPFCDGWEVRDQPLAVYGRGAAGHDVAIALRAWSTDIVLCTDGPTRLSHAYREDLARLGIPVLNARIARLEGDDGQLQRIVLRGGKTLERRAMFVTLGQDPGSDLAMRLGCTKLYKGAVRTDRYERTEVPGLYVVGDASWDTQIVAVAVAEGAKAGMAIHRALDRAALAARANVHVAAADEATSAHAPDAISPP